MGKYSRCVIIACDDDMRNPELHKKHRWTWTWTDVDGQTSNPLTDFNR